MSDPSFLDRTFWQQAVSGVIGTVVGTGVIVGLAYGFRRLAKFGRLYLIIGYAALAALVLVPPLIFDAYRNLLLTVVPWTYLSILLAVTGAGIAGFFLRELLAWLGSRETFERIKVQDGKFGMEWHIRRDPREWIDDPELKDRTFGQQESLLAGPYHADPTCSAALEVSAGGGYRGDGPSIRDRCLCGITLFSCTQYVPLWSIRTQVLTDARRGIG